MYTLAKQIRKVLKENDYELNPEVTDIDDIIEYIEMKNRENGNDEYYSPEEWLADTKINFPEYLLTKDELQKKYYEPTLFYLIKEYKACVDQTGEKPGAGDLIESMQCEAFNMHLRSYELDPKKFDLSLMDIMCYLLDYWDCH